MISGHLRNRNGVYYTTLSYYDSNGKRKIISKSTGLTIKGNKKKAEEILRREREKLEEKLKYSYTAQGENVLFTDFLKDWLEIIKSTVEVTTYSGYELTIKNKVIPYFEKNHPGLKLSELTAKTIQDYYTYEMKVNKLSANTESLNRCLSERTIKPMFIFLYRGIADCSPQIGSASKSCP